MGIFSDIGRGFDRANAQQEKAARMQAQMPQQQQGQNIFTTGLGGGNAVSKSTNLGDAPAFDMFNMMGMGTGRVNSQHQKDYRKLEAALVETCSH